MKKEISSEWNDKFKEITTKDELNPSSVSTFGFSIPANEEFVMVGIGKVLANGTINEHDAILVEIKSTKKQLPISNRLWQGTYFVVEKQEDGTLKSVPQNLDTVYRKSGLNLFDFFEKFSNKTFVSTEPVKYKGVKFGTTDTIQDKSIMTYKLK